ncbi:MAG: hypothetical protein ACTHKG_14405 [Nocardioides sp.]
MRRRTVLTGLLAWSLVVVAVSAITWAVIDAAGQDLLAGDNLLTDAAPAVTSTAPAVEPSPRASPREPRSRRPRAHPSHTPAQQPAATPPPSPATRTPGQPARSRTWQGPPGTATVRCEADNITLLSASPNNGYRVEVERGSDEIEVHFKSSTREYQVKARCSDGTPTFRVESNGGEEKDD